MSARDIIIRPIVTEKTMKMSSDENKIAFVVDKGANKVSDALQAKHGEIPWGDIIGMRNILIHDYVRPRPEYMWDAYRNDLLP